MYWAVIYSSWMWLGILMLQSLTKTQNLAKMELETHNILCQCACCCLKRKKRARHLLWWTAAWEMCTVWLVLQGDMLVNYKTMVMFCCLAVVSSSAWFPLQALLGFCCSLLWELVFTNLPPQECCVTLHGQNRQCLKTSVWDDTKASNQISRSSVMNVIDSSFTPRHLKHVECISNFNNLAETTKPEFVKCASPCATS